MRKCVRWKVWLLSVGMVLAFAVNFLRPAVWAVEAGTGSGSTDAESGYAQAADGDGVPDVGTDAESAPRKSERPSVKNPDDGQEMDAGLGKNGKPSAEVPTERPGGDPSGEIPDTEADGQEDGGEAVETPGSDPSEEIPDTGAGGQEDGGAAVERPGGDPSGEIPDTEADGQEGGEAAAGVPDGGEAGEGPDTTLEGTEEPGQNVPAPDAPVETQADSAGANTSGKITLDGSSEDWDRSEIKTLSPVDNSGSSNFAVAQWRVARDVDGTVYLCIQGDANEYEAGNAQWVSFSVTQNGTSVTQQVNGIPGGTYQYQCGANGTSKAPFVLEVMIPADYFTDPNFTITFGGCSAPAEMIPVLNGVEPEPDQGTEPEPPVYSGIGIDGGFQDWSAVNKYDPHDANQCIDQMAVVYDRDVYVYIREVNGGSAAGSGTHSNGKYAITTDLGEVLLFQLNEDGTISGPAGAEAVRVGGEWEIRIPADALPRHKQTISVGLYMAEPAVSDVANLSGGGGTGSFDGIVIDGQYSDWDNYPSTQIQYATAGTQEHVTDARAALYAEGGVLYGHVSTTMPVHLDSKGGALLDAISITFNGDREYKGYPTEGNFYPVIRRQDGSNEILNDRTRLENGTYTFEILDGRTAGNNPQVYGTVVITVNGYQDEMEFTLDLEKVAEYTGMDVRDMKLIEAQFGKLGQEWVSTGGTSSGPWLVLAAAPAVALLCSRRRREECAA